MMKSTIIIISIVFAAVFNGNSKNIFVCNSGEVTFFSEAPVENIDATSKSMHSILNTSNNEIVFVVAMRSFQFKKALMEEHFNEKYLESDKYPNGSYKGKIDETIDYSKNGEYDVSSSGILTIHGVDQQRTE